MIDFERPAVGGREFLPRGGDPRRTIALTPRQMRELERRYMDETGVSSEELMRRAALCVVEALAERLQGV